MMRRAFTQKEADQHDALVAKAWALIQKRILLDKPKSVRKPSWFTQRKLHQAIDLFEGALRINPEDWSSMWALGKIHQELSDYQAALDRFSQAYRINPTQPDVAREAGLVALDLGHGELAVTFCEAAVNNQPNDPGLVANLAWAYLITGDVKQAQRCAQGAVDHNPRDQVSHTVLRIVNEVASGARPAPRSLQEIKGSTKA